MRMLPATSNAFMRNALSSAIVATTPSSNTQISFAILLYKGEMPTAEKMNQYGTMSQSSIYGSMSAFSADTSANYVGGIAGLRPATSLLGDQVPVLTASAMNNKIVSTNTDDRDCYFLEEVAPTWFMLYAQNSTLNAASSLNLTTGVFGASAIPAFLVLGSVGDENSNADMKILGGKIYPNTSTPTDQSKAVIVSDLLLSVVR